MQNIENKCNGIKIPIPIPTIPLGGGESLNIPTVIKEKTIKKNVN